MKDKTSAPNALICGKCFESQRKTNVSGEDEFYCEHHHVWAIRRPDGGWLLSTDVSPERKPLNARVRAFWLLFP